MVRNDDRYWAPFQEVISEAAFAASGRILPPDAAHHQGRDAIVRTALYGPRCLVAPLRGDGVLAPTELTDISSHGEDGGKLASQYHLCPFTCRAASPRPSPSASRRRTAWHSST